MPCIAAISSWVPIGPKPCQGQARLSKLDSQHQPWVPHSNPCFLAPRLLHSAVVISHGVAMRVMYARAFASDNAAGLQLVVLTAELCAAPHEASRACGVQLNARANRQIDQSQAHFGIVNISQHENFVMSKLACATFSHHLGAPVDLAEDPATLVTSKVKRSGETLPAVAGRFHALETH